MVTGEQMLYRLVSLLFNAVAGAQAFEGGFLVAEGSEKGVGELGRVEGLEGQIGNGLFDFYGVHGVWGLTSGLLRLVVVAWGLGKNEVRQGGLSITLPHDKGVVLLRVPGAVPAASAWPGPGGSVDF